MGATWLHSRGLEPARDYQFRIAGSHNSALMSVVSGETAAAVAGRSAFKQLAAQFKHEITVLGAVGEVMGLVVLAKRDLGNPLPELERSLAAFPHITEGWVFVERNGIGGFERIQPAELRKLDRYMPETLRWLNEDPRLVASRKTNDAANHHGEAQPYQGDQGVDKQTAGPTQVAPITREGVEQKQYY